MEQLGERPIFWLLLGKFVSVGSEREVGEFFWDFRCVDEKDKPVAIGFGLMLMSLFAFVPSPILFGIILG